MELELAGRVTIEDGALSRVDLAWIPRTEPRSEVVGRGDPGPASSATHRPIRDDCPDSVLDGHQCDTPTTSPMTPATTFTRSEPCSATRPTKVRPSLEAEPEEVPRAGLGAPRSRSHCFHGPADAARPRWRTVPSSSILPPFQPSRIVPRCHDPSYWLDEPTEPLPHADLDRDADVAVVGGGITGCSCALALAEAGMRVRLFEAREIAGGASGRNGGFALRGGAAPYPVLVESIGDDATAALWRWTETELVELAALAGDAFRPTGSLRLAVGRRGARRAARGVRGARDAGLRSRVARGSRRIARRGTRLRSSIRPTASCSRLGSCAASPERAEAGVEIHEHTRVDSIDESRPTCRRRDGRVSERPAR